MMDKTNTQPSSPGSSVPDEWYLSKEHETMGPFALTTLKQMLKAGAVSGDAQVAREGANEWSNLEDVLTVLAENQGQKKLPPPPKASDEKGDESMRSPDAEPDYNVFRTFHNGFSKIAGLEKLEGFSLIQLFSQTFRFHKSREIEEHFNVGTLKTTPALEDVPTTWPAPWAFLRLLMGSLVLSYIFYRMLEHYETPILVPAWLFTGSFGIPFAMLVFFFETNILRNISFYRLANLMFLGGCLSILITFLLNDISFLDETVGASSAGIIEEIAKLAAVVVFTALWKGYNWTLNGILFGAAVGTGFAAFETAGYVVASSMYYDEPTSVMLFRGLLTPFCHVIWTAAAAGALWRVRRTGKSLRNSLVDVRFLRVLAIVIALHFTWNSPLAGIPVWICLGIIGWLLIFLLIQHGLQEVYKAKQSMKAQQAGSQDLTPGTSESQSSFRAEEKDDENAKNDGPVGTEGDLIKR